ncbi:MAG: hypothetical protein ACM3KD_00785 [Hyphomicrobiaceae bacterium]
MILRRITEHVRDQNWFAVGIDLVIVVVGVFIGLEVQQWADVQRQGRLERIYTEKLQAEVLNLMATRAPTVEARNRVKDGLASTTQALFGTEQRELSDLECQSIASSYVISNPTDDLAALVELQSTGQLSVLSNPRVSEALGAFLLVRARAQDSLAGINRNQLNLQLRHPHLVRVTAPSSMDVATDSFVFGSFRCDLDGMRASPQFRNDYELNQTNFALHARDNARVDASLRALNQVLMDVLGLPREMEAR